MNPLTPSFFEGDWIGDTFLRRLGGFECLLRRHMAFGSLIAEPKTQTLVIAFVLGSFKRPTLIQLLLAIGGPLRQGWSSVRDFDHRDSAR